MLEPTSIHLFSAAIRYHVELRHGARSDSLCGGEGEVANENDVGDWDAETTRKLFCFLFASDSGEHFRTESIGNLNCGRASSYKGRGKLT